MVRLVVARGAVAMVMEARAEAEKVGVMVVAERAEGGRKLRELGAANKVWWRWEERSGSATLRVCSRTRAGCRAGAQDTSRR